MGGCFLKKGYAMRIKCHATATAHGVFLSDIASDAETESLRCFFSEMGTKAIGPPGDRQILLVGLNLERFSMLIEGANIELVNTLS